MRRAFRQAEKRGEIPRGMLAEAEEAAETEVIGRTEAASSDDVERRGQEVAGGGQENREETTMEASAVKGKNGNVMIIAKVNNDELLLPPSR